ncbi:hypothetical protein BCR42DRAFT_450504 [Absidia repens]|uniref:Uncharacterized protein n=1 Tax=Absidia repens TaxID=90262 RepID=A0A1X2IKE3_9FUNG|nr:hypothetical protein BCR42DRAFT_450504 [Absidia repens]
MYPNNSNNSSDQFDNMMASITQGSIAMAFRQLIEPADSNGKKRDLESKTAAGPPPLKLHDFGGSDFVRLAEKSRRNRLATSKSQEPTGYGLGKLNAPLSPGNGSPHYIGTSGEVNSLAVENQSAMKQTQQSPPNNDRKCTQECVFKKDGSEETVYQKFHNGQATEVLHHMHSPEGTINDINKPTITSSTSVASSLSSTAHDTTSTSSPFKRLWHLVFD